MTKERRQLFLSIVDNYEDFHSITERLYFLDLNFPREKLNRALRILVREGVIGHAFVKFVREECIGSNLELHRKLLSILEKKSGYRPVIIGKDFKQ